MYYAPGIVLRALEILVHLISSQPYVIDPIIVPIFSDELTEVQRGPISCPKAHS